MSVRWGLLCHECQKATPPTFSKRDFLHRLKELFSKLRPFYRLLRREDHDGLIHDELLAQLKFLNAHREHLDDVEPAHELSREMEAARDA